MATYVTQHKRCDKCHASTEQNPDQEFTTYKWTWDTDNLEVDLCEGCDDLKAVSILDLYDVSRVIKPEPKKKSTAKRGLDQPSITPDQKPNGMFPCGYEGCDREFTSQAGVAHHRTRNNHK